MENNTKNYYEGFPTLQAKQNELDNKVAALRKKMADVRTTERYRDNQSEREYQISKLSEEMEATLSKAQADFDLELQAIEQSVAESVFAPISGDESTLSDARQTVEGITQQMMIDTTPIDSLPFLAVRAKSLNDIEKTMLARELPKVSEYAASRSRNNMESREIANYIDQIHEACNETKRGRETAEQRQQLTKIKQGGTSIRSTHDTVNKITRGYGSYAGN